MASTLLTDSKIRGLKPKKSAYYTWQASATRGTGRLGVKIYPSGRKVFIYRYFNNGKEKFINLGDFPALSLAKALSKSQDAAANISATEKVIINHATIEQLFKDYISDQKRRGKRSYDKTEYRLNQVLDSQHIDRNAPAKDITPDHIKRVLAEFISRGAVAGSNKVRSNLHAVFNFGLFADNDPAKLNEKVIYGLDRNPVTVVPRQEGVDKALDRFLSWDEIKSILKLFRVSASIFPIHPDYGRLLLLCIFTGGQRPWEIMTNTRDNWDKNNNTLTVPPHISKNSDYHVIPLCKSATEILEHQAKQYPDSGFLFPGETKEGHLLTAEYAKQIRKFCTRYDFEKFTPRDIRRTFKTLAGEMGVSSEMRDKVQNHKRPGVSSKHYDRYSYLKEKREIIGQWERKLLSL
ncbi:tyrosine-type recombinase/integrase [Xenorhabdus griffiniae]|uniref:Site-specific integrase n=1 Tax=Xenorhabdus griffiniae TaxID=351672 RepID=A0ABY9XFJ1_9GAMM|nr:site-specific integrase [Xenorhabdus griffiniae]MBD1229012.1 site-specific integrase [Xenorhabdus griffiniae]MBE8588741.1 site-specific integrase [Xenorhabdus griffiniae]WMV71644.1 site-specific integrase [Xenorhabdus griffiniae]WNH01321.1 site-specific integrase [Xenorhabdus griffiniae]